MGEMCSVCNWQQVPDSQTGSGTCSLIGGYGHGDGMLAGVTQADRPGGYSQRLGQGVGLPV